MAVPFSNTHLRVPHGFGTLLEGLAREILRDQPEDIPKYAAQYFETLLKQREESGMDPAEWAAKLEDRFYNNHAFKTSPQPIPEEETTTDVTGSIDKIYDSQAEDDSSKSAEATAEPIVTEEVNLTESTEEEEEKDIMSLERKLSQEGLDIILSGADVKSEDLSESEEETNPAINKLDQVDRESIESESNLFVDQSELESTDFLLFDGTANVEVCGQELETTEDQENNKQKTDVNKDISNSEDEEENTVEEPVEVFPYSGLADVDVCATELGEKEKKLDRATDENDAHGDEDTTAPREHIRSGIQDDKLQMEEAEKEVNLEEEHMEIHHDVSEVMKRKMDSNDSDLNYSDDGENREGVENISSSNLPTTEEEEEKPETEIDHKNEETESISNGELHQNPDFEKQPNLNDSKDETKEAAGEDKWDIHTEDFKEMEEEEIDDSVEENALSTVTLSNVSTAPVETEGGTFEGIAQYLLEENVEIQESHPEDTMVEKEATSKEEELPEEEADDTEIQQKSNAMYEDIHTTYKMSISLPQRADGTDGDNQEEETPLESEKATTEPEGKSIETQEECSRPQEEEDIMDIPLDDPEANRAAAKIQAGFRGHMTRKKMKPEDKAEGEERQEDRGQ